MVLPVDEILQRQRQSFKGTNARVRLAQARSELEQLKQASRDAIQVSEDRSRIPHRELFPLGERRPMQDQAREQHTRFLAQQLREGNLSPEALSGTQRMLAPGVRDPRLQDAQAGLANALRHANLEGVDASTQAQGLGGRTLTFLDRALQVIDAPAAAIRGTFDPDTDPWENFVAALDPEERAEFFAGEFEGPLPTVGGFLLDILTDPITYVTFGVGGVAKAAAAPAARAVVGTAARHGTQAGARAAARQVYRTSAKRVTRLQQQAKSLQAEGRNLGRAARLERRADDLRKTARDRAKKAGEAFAEVSRKNNITPDQFKSLESALEEFGRRGFSLAGEGRAAARAVPGQFRPGVRARAPFVPQRLRARTISGLETQPFTPGTIQPGQALARAAGQGVRRVPGGDEFIDTFRRNLDHFHHIRQGLNDAQFRDVQHLSRRMLQRQNILQNQARKYLEDLGDATRRGLTGSEIERLGIEGVSSSYGEQAAEAVRFLTDDLHDLARRAGMDIGKIENYFPHVITDQDVLRAIRDHTGHRLSASQAERAARSFATSKFQRRRNLPGFVDDLNEWARREIGAPIFEENPVAAFDIYARSITRGIARHEMLQEAQKRGLAIPSVRRFVENTPVPRVNAEQPAVRRTLEQALGEARTARGELTEQAHARIPRIGRQREDIQRHLDTLESRKGVELKPAHRRELENWEDRLYQRLQKIEENDANFVRHLSNSIDEVKRLEVELSKMPQNLPERQTLARLRELVSDIPEGWEKMRGPGGEVFVPEPVKLYFDNVVDAMRPTNPAWRAWDRVTSYWRAVAISTVGFFARNQYGILWQNHVLFGVPFEEGVKSMHILAHSVDGMTKRARTRALEGIPTTPRNTAAGQITEQDFRFLREAFEDGAVDSGMIRGEFFGTDPVTGRGRGQLVNPLSRDFLLWRAVHKPQQAVENNARFTIYRWARMNGASRREATETVGMSHFFYSELTPLEQNYIRNAIPFYTWFKRNTKLQLEKLLERPRQFARLHDLQRTTEELSDRDARSELMGARTVNRQPMPIPGTDAYSVQDLPTGELTQLPDPTSFSNVNPFSGALFRNLWIRDQFSPWFERTIDLAAGEDMTGRVRGADIEAPVWARGPGVRRALERSGALYETPDGPRMSYQGVQSMEAFFPFLARARWMWPEDPEDQERFQQRMLSLWAGLGFRRPVRQEQERELERRARDVQRLVEQRRQRRRAEQGLLDERGRTTVGF